MGMRRWQLSPAREQSCMTRGSGTPTPPQIYVPDGLGDFMDALSDPRAFLSGMTWDSLWTACDLHIYGMSASLAYHKVW